MFVGCAASFSALLAIRSVYPDAPVSISSLAHTPTFAFEPVQADFASHVCALIR
jgi:hypothetical protein